MSNHTFTFTIPGASRDDVHHRTNVDTVVVTLSFETLVLRLRHAFGTSHSSTTERRNALFTCTWILGNDLGAMNGGPSPVKGFGESGLPPKKPKCYLADVDDCRNTFDLFTTALSLSLANSDAPIDAVVAAYNGFAGLGGASDAATSGWFPFVHLPHLVSNTFPANTTARRVFLFLLSVLDGVTLEPIHRAAKSGIEAALLDCWCKVLGVSFPYFANLNHPLRSSTTDNTTAAPPPAATRSFYTAALNESIDEMKSSTEFGLAYTSAIKIKLDSDVDRARAILETFADATYGSVWSIDANAAWTPAVASRYVTLIQDLFQPVNQNEERRTFPKLLMVEQPWAASFVPTAPSTASVEHTESLAGETNEATYWRTFRKALNAVGVRVYADESIATVADVELFASAGIVDGVNIKLEKAGGIRSALRAACRARELGLYVWIGTMVSSALGCCQAAQVAVVADDSDVDGGLLAFPDRFDGGFTWRPEDGGILLHRGPEGATVIQREASSPPPEWAGFGISVVVP